jgi:type IV pilus assembly protein PilE
MKGATMKFRLRGFTLIELMVTVAVVAILAAIAYPSFLDQVRKSRRSAGKAVLLQTVQNIERFYTLSNSYASAVTSVVGASGVLSENGYYLVTSASATSSTYSLSATPQGGQASDRCQTLTIDQLAQKGTSSGLPVSECW